jgi:hypothetical protein
MNPIWNFIILKKKKNHSLELEGKKKKKNQPTAGETQPWVSVDGREVFGRGPDPFGKTQPFRGEPSSFFFSLLFSFFSLHHDYPVRQDVGFFFAFFFSLCEVTAHEWWAENPSFTYHPN